MYELTHLGIWTKVGIFRVIMSPVGSKDSWSWYNTRKIDSNKLRMRLKMTIIKNTKRKWEKYFNG